jgi:hypothetical protein
VRARPPAARVNILSNNEMVKIITVPQEKRNTFLRAFIRMPSGAKTVPRNPKNKNIPYKINDFKRISPLYNKENTGKNAILIS